MSNLTAIVTCLALLLYGVLGARVGSARVKYNIPAPATTGHPAFERAFRIQANTGEQLLLLLPGFGCSRSISGRSGEIFLVSSGSPDGSSMPSAIAGIHSGADRASALHSWRLRS
jgi:hypothetical protein